MTEKPCPHNVPPDFCKKGNFYKHFSLAKQFLMNFFKEMDIQIGHSTYIQLCLCLIKFHCNCFCAAILHGHRNFMSEVGCYYCADHNNFIIFFLFPPSVRIHQLSIVIDSKFPGIETSFFHHYSKYRESIIFINSSA